MKSYRQPYDETRPGFIKTPGRSAVIVAIVGEQDILRAAVELDTIVCIAKHSAIIGDGAAVE